MFSSRRNSGFGRRFANWVWPSIGLRRAWTYRMHRLARMKAGPHQLALGFAAGAFASFTPFIGFHFILAALAALVIRGNLVASAVGTVVGNPVTFPFIWLATYNIGAALLGMESKRDVVIATDHAVSALGSGPLAWFEMLRSGVAPVIAPMLLGGIPLGIACGAACYWLVLTTLQGFQARRRTALARDPARRRPAGT